MKPYLKQFLKEDVNFDVNFIASFYKDGKYVKSIPIFMKSTIKEAYSYACKIFGVEASEMKENDKHSPYVYVYENDNTYLIINSIDGNWRKE